MSVSVTELVPEAIRTLSYRPLLAVRLEVHPQLVVGQTPGAFRRVGVVTGGAFEGERLRGTVLQGSDWQTVRADGAWTLDVRLVMRTDDGDLIGMTYRGLRHGPPEVIARITAGEQVEAGSYYFRINPMFETASEKYGWLNRILAVGIGHRVKEGPIYNVFEIL